jgi:hypothetical protein
VYPKKTLLLFSQAEMTQKGATKHSCVAANCRIAPALVKWTFKAKNVELVRLFKEFSVRSRINSGFSVARRRKCKPSIGVDANFAQM